MSFQLPEVRRLWLSPYILKVRSGSKEGEIKGVGEVEGLLLRCEFTGGDLEVGYGCLQSWPQLGEPSIKELLCSLPAGVNSSQVLVLRALAMAREDALARAEERSLLTSIEEIPLSHCLNPQRDFDPAEQGYSHIKLKLQAQEKQKNYELLNFWIKRMRPQQRLRLDFNGSFQSSSEFSSWWREAESWLSPWIDFIEDPVSDGDLESWFGMEQSAPVAADRQRDERILNQSQIRIWKPLVSQLDLNIGRRVVATTNLDHPLGQIFAMAQAQTLIAEVCGLQTVHFYEPNEFSECITYQGPKTLVHLEGWGLGFKPQLEALHWHEVEVL